MLTQTGEWSDPGQDQCTATVDYGDGSAVLPLTLAGGAFALSHRYGWTTLVSKPRYTVTVTGHRRPRRCHHRLAGGHSPQRLSLVGPITMPVDLISVSNDAFAAASFTDPGVLDTHTATWTWGDGGDSAGVVTEAEGSGAVSGAHCYCTPASTRSP